MSQQSGKTRIAITGGGLAGALMIHALAKHEHLHVDIFESAPVFREAGLAIGVTRNAYQALELIGPSAVQCLEEAESTTHYGIFFMLAQGPHAGEIADEIDAKKEGKRLTNIVHRASFLKEVLEHVPRAHMHPSKKLSGVQHNADGSLTLEFKDGSMHDCDILIGADGVSSTVRKIILGEDDPAANPVFAGWLGYPSLHPYEKLQPVLGERFVSTDDPREWSWLGDGAFMMHNVLSGGKQIQFIATFKTDSHPDKTRVPMPTAAFREKFRDWPTHLRAALDKVLGDAETIDVWNMREHLPARTYVDGPVCVIGDAAHSTTAWQASGGGTTIEDVLILSTLLIRSKSISDARTALQVYDQVRRPRTARVVQSSRETGLAFCGRNPEYPLTIPGLNERFRKRWDFILDFDNKKARDEAVQIFDERISK